MRYRILTSSQKYQIETQVNDLAEQGWDVVSLTYAAGNFIVIMEMEPESEDESEDE
jgi:hypothetical protein